MEPPQASGAAASASSPAAAAEGASEAAAAAPAGASGHQDDPSAAAAAAGAAASGTGVNRSEAAADIPQKDMKEDRFLQATLRVRANGGFLPNCLFLPNAAEECTREGQTPRLRLEMVQEILIEQTQILWKTKTQNLFRANAEAYRRLTDDTYTKYLPAEGRAAAVAAVQEQLVNNCVLLLSCLELFELADPPPTQEVRKPLAAAAGAAAAGAAAAPVAMLSCMLVSRQFTEFLEGGAATAFITQLLTALRESPGGEETAAAAFRAAIEAFFAALTGRGVGDYKAPAVGAIRFLSSFKPIASFIAAAPCFMPSFSPLLPGSQPGFYLQENSLLGRLLSFSPLEGPVLPILKNICRAGKVERHRVVQWFAAVLSSNEARAKAAHVHMMLQQQTPESADPLHSFLIKAQGQNSFGFCINVFHALLLLVEPIKYEKICEVSPFYATCGSASDTVRQAVAGPLRREALLGEGEAAAAAKQFYKTIAADDANAKFTSEIFWLTIRAVRLCFNPCASECMRWMEYFQRRHEEGMQQNSAESKQIVAEVLGWRVILLHPRLCSLYWHFAHLFCSWLLGCMYIYTSDGKEDPKAVSFLSNQKWRYAALLTQLPPGGAEKPATPPPQFALLPSGIVEEIFLSLRHMAELQAVEVTPVESASAAACVAFGTAAAAAAAAASGRFGSYYDRINFRIPIVDMLSRLLANPDYRANMKTLAETHPEKFLHLVHLLLNDVAALVDQAMEALVEIRKRQLEGRDNDQAPLPGQAAPRGAAGAAAGAAAGTGASSGSANARGPQGAPSSMEEEDSDGDEVQADKTNGEVIITEILRDGRYYKHANIAKACRIARREGLMPSALLEEFHSLVKRLAEMEQAEKEIDLDDVPPEFLDPIMADLMCDPVMLPSSRVIVDRRNIERHLMSEPSDPFNRAPLTREELIPQPELKKAIEEFTEAKRKAAAANRPSKT
ncbi:ubiquitin conjugation factor, putative [Eimeria acervulina]|uniref:RING-type E3 ubiquitin transferase n=1 Tax=Eimeria acervulina TaxID=5801 RepID=U6GQ58_EIMAC|nr:ubiquitin conjugation factor, putative [Eimeria acervulina]CDI81697.1 ubiquitin conjugation factor, putative [Eimeria acervulina]